ncbi:transcription antitermination factor NusB [Arcanobacterium pinnipediorum]|uniref:16S rRNA methyltransferase n=1 Tax=Arcanobacterium pinnipediorum TaxID=1503041 RepID=A0ABY5AFZ7_9ACTO|nr:transcription antitermination factor NusB [Arcanobacterium pinnipediorum]USR78626.1 16S rRNA methyltransferase [Arcanobacterium pinnipediorum]
MNSQRPTNWKPGRGASDKARLVVFDVLMDVERQGAYANLALPREIRRAHLNKQDAAYATNLCYGTLRLQGRWDAIIAHCTNGRSISDLDTEVRVLLRMGAHQLLEFRTPPHAAINETVVIARNELSQGIAGLVNAVLRRVSERSLSQWQEQLKRDAADKVNSVAFLSSWFSHPQWIVRALDKALQYHGRTHKDILSVLRSDNEPAAVALAARGLSVAQLRNDIERGHMQSRPGYLVDDALLLEGGDPHRVFAVKDRLAGVQDEGSQLVAKTLAGAQLETEDDLWLDMCAGPGGKTATLAGIARERGARIHANELHRHRLELVLDSVQPWSDIVDVRHGDARDFGSENRHEIIPAHGYARVLIDAPCTGIGALRRRPEARWRKEAGDALDLAQLQAQLLEAGWSALRPGGVLAYSTCSPYLSETSDIINAFAQQHPDAIRLDTPAIASTQSRIALQGVNGELQLWPDLHNSDAMYLVLIAKPLSTTD